MDITKAAWHADEHSFHVTVPFAKVNKQTRVVSGWATLDNLDSHGDIVLKEASEKAFARWRGNIREMHQPIAAGKMVSFKEDSFFNPDDGKMYNGVWVDAYISKGAPDTWEKVNDGTLTGFSIGGEILQQEKEWNKDADKSVRFIKDYQLIELSLVDNPANPLANVLTIQKSADGESLVFKGLAVEVEAVNVFWCPVDKVAKYTSSETTECNHCHGTMTNIGWFESTEDNEAAVKEVVNKFLGDKDAEIGKGGVEMAKNEEEEKVVPDPATPDARAEAAEEADKEAPQEEATVSDDVDAGATDSAGLEPADAVPVDEVNTNEPDFEKMAEGLRADLETLLEKATTVTKEAVEPLKEKLDEFEKSFGEKSSELEEGLFKLGERIGGLEGQTEEVQKRLEVLDGETAVKKSGDVESPEKLEKSDEEKFWGGAFTPVRYTSVEDL